MRKIGLIIHSLKIGGMERVMAILASDFANRADVQVHLILFGRFREITFSIPESVVIHQPNFIFDNRSRSRDTMKTLFFLRRKIKEINPVTILSFGELWNNFVLLAVMGLPYPVYISDRSEPGKNLGFLQNILRKHLYQTATGFIAQTKEAEKKAKNNKWNSNIRIIGNPIRKISESPEIERENIVLSVGRIIPSKHIDTIIRIFTRCEMEDWKLIIVGGNDRNEKLLEDYSRIIKMMDMEAKIELVGQKNDVDSYYKRSKIFCFASSSEGFPNVVGEAMSAGLPVVAFDGVAGVSDMIVNNKTGCLIPNRNEELFKEKLLFLMKSDLKRENMGRAGRDKIQEFNTTAIADQFFDFITK